jgi:hypothetical protein
MEGRKKNEPLKYLSLESQVAANVDITANRQLICSYPNRQECQLMQGTLTEGESSVWLTSSLL